MIYIDGEILGLDTDGKIIQWNALTGSSYNCGETPEEFGLSNMSEIELARIGK